MAAFTVWFPDQVLWQVLNRVQCLKMVSVDAPRILTSMVDLKLRRYIPMPHRVRDSMSIETRTPDSKVPISTLGKSALPLQATKLDDLNLGIESIYVSGGVGQIIAPPYFHSSHLTFTFS